MMAVLAPSGLRAQVPLAPMTTWQVGGPARQFVEPNDQAALMEAVAWAKAEGLAWTVMGRGSNLLVADEGFDGLVIRLGNAFSGLRFEGDRMWAMAGVPLAQMVVAAQKAGLGGLEPMVGVPGTVGGALAMNAGAHGVEIQAGFVGAQVLQADGQMAWWAKEDFHFSYRHSRLQDEGGVVLEGEWRLTPTTVEEGRAKVQQLQQWRHAKQPTNQPSGGSTFRNPEGESRSAGAIIEAMGLKGFRIGGAEVSEKHANFIVNCGGATAQDIDDLIRHIQGEAWARFGLWLHPEVKGLGRPVGAPRPQPGHG